MVSRSFGESAVSLVDEYVVCGFRLLFLIVGLGLEWGWGWVGWMGWNCWWRGVYLEDEGPVGK